MQSDRYRVSEKMVEDAGPPPKMVKKYVVFDRSAMVEVDALYDSWELANKDCQSMNALELKK